ncbi:hypothetical protein [Actinomadura oligospora]|uniref:hypothetical protein n=1 Tax=Actinomadura oligospora TaxID=111804 RepID=UPI0012F974D6|nr:hypothetical protein [Actinomadura oligospora]
MSEIEEQDQALWPKPSPLGSAAALDAMASIAAPPLAGFALATIAVVAQSAGSFRWPGLCILFCAATAAFLVMSIQYGFTARAFFYSPADIGTWWPEASDDRTRQAWLKAEHEQHHEQWRRYATRARFAYNAGVIALSLTLAVLAAPPAGAGQASLRWVAAGLSLLAAAGTTTTAIRRTRVLPRARTEEP